MESKDAVWLPTRHTLIARLRNLEDKKSWADFFDLYGRLIFAVARGQGLSHQEAEDVVQEVVISVARKIDRFKPGREHGSFKAWLGRLIRWRIVDQVRRRATELRAADLQGPSPGTAGDSTTSLLARVPAPTEDGFQRQWDTEWATEVEKRAMAKLKKRVQPIHYQIYQQHVMIGRSADEVAKAFGVPVARVYLIKSRLNQVLRKECLRFEEGVGPA